MARREQTFAEMLTSARVDADRRRAAAPPDPLPPPPRLPRLDVEGVLSPSGRLYRELDGGLIGMQRMRSIGLQGAALLVNPLGEGYWCSRDLDGANAADDALEWYDADLVRQAAERAEPVCRSLTIVSLLEDDDGGLLLEVDGDGLIWPPVPRARP